VGETIVAFAFSMPLGILMAIGTGGLAVVGKAREQSAARHARPLLNIEAVENAALYVDSETGLPNRNHLLDQLSREIARADRYQQPLTLAVVELERMDDIEAGWGTDVTTRAVAHVARAMGRITRTSDFLARVDNHRFAVALMKCTGDQAKKFAERVEIAVSNRPIRGGSRMRGVPVYLSVRVTTLQYDRTRLRGPLDFLSRAGGEMVVQEERTALPKGANRHPEKAQTPAAIAPEAPLAHDTERLNLRRQVDRDYYPDGKAEDFADAYKAFRGKKAS
jgi:diguanylate cyclase (GGDEF)-like protein